MEISLNFQTSCCNLKIRGLGAKPCVAFLIFWFWKELWREKVKQSMHIVERKIWTLIKTKRNRKWKILLTILERQTLCFSSYKNRKLKLKLCWVGARERKKWAFFAPFILSDRNFLTFVFYLNGGLNILSEYTYFYVSKNITSYTFDTCFQNHLKLSVYP